MNDKQFEQAKKQLREEMNANGYGWIDGKYIKPPKKYELRDQELWCISMINSILCYNCQGFTDAEAVMQHEEKRYHNYLAEYVELLGRDRVVALIQGQIDSIAGVQHGVFTDDEGLTYNSIIWKENTDMRIKKQFLNEESLKPYGFTKEVLYGNENLVEYTKKGEYADILIQRIHGDISIVFSGDGDCVNIPDVVYHLIQDGLVTIKEETA